MFWYEWKIYFPIFAIYILRDVTIQKSQILIHSAVKQNRCAMFWNWCLSSWLFCAMFSFWDMVDFVFTFVIYSGLREFRNYHMLGGLRPTKPSVFVGGLAPHAPHQGLRPHVPGTFQLKPHWSKVWNLKSLNQVRNQIHHIRNSKISFRTLHIVWYNVFFHIWSVKTHENCKQNRS